MQKKYLRIPALIILAIILIAGWALAYGPRPSAAPVYDIPRILGLEGEEQAIQINGTPSSDIHGPIFETHGAAISMDVDLRSLPQTGPEKKRLSREMGQFPRLTPDQGPDPVIQTNDTVGDGPLRDILAAAPAPLSSFKGLDLQNWGGGWPPDTHGDVGPNHYIQAVNTSVGIYSKTTGARLAAFTINNFFSAAGASGVCATGNNGDPIVLYDQVSGRWIITDFAWLNTASGPYYECIAVSKTADPLSGGWWIFTLTADSTSLNDYPKLGIWNDGIYMSSNLFDCLNSGCSSANYSGAKVWALNRDDLISGASLRSIAFSLGTSYYSLLPANMKGAAAPSGTPEYFMSDNTSASMSLWKFTANWSSPGSSTFTGPTNFSVASFTQPSANVPQKNTSVKLDTLGDRLMSWLQYRNIGGTQSLWVSRTVVAGSSTGIRWMEVRNMSATPSVYQQGTYAPDSTYRWMPSLAVDGAGNMAVGYSVSSSTMFPAIRYAGRLATDTLGLLGQTETSLIEGTGSQTSYSRWGDYSSMSVDPVDDCTFWFTTEYYESTGTNWQTRIGSFQFPSCVSAGPTATPTSTSVPTATTTATQTPTPTFTPTATSTATGGSGEIINPGFESGSGVGWTEYSARGYEIISPVRPHDGTYSAYLCNYNSCNEYVEQTVTVPSNGSLTYWWYMTSSDSKIASRDYLRVQVYSTNGALLSTLRTWSNKNPRAAWKQDTLSLSAYAGQTVILRFASTTNTSFPTAFWIDDVTMSGGGVSATPTAAFTPTSTAVTGTNLLINPGFEEGPGIGWTEFSSGAYELVTTTLPRSGSFSAYLCNYNSCTEYVQQTVTVPSNGSLAYWWYLTSSDTKLAAYDRLKVQVYSTSGRLLKTLRAFSNVNTREVWSQDTVSLSLYAGKTVVIRFTVTTDKSYPSAFWIDDVVVK